MGPPHATSMYFTSAFTTLRHVVGPHCISFVVRTDIASSLRYRICCYVSSLSVRKATTYPRPRNRTNCYKSFTHHALL